MLVVQPERASEARAARAAASSSSASSPDQTGYSATSHSNRVACCARPRVIHWNRWWWRSRRPPPGAGCPCPRGSLARPHRRAREALGGQAHGVEDLLVAGAAAQVAGQRLADLGVAGARAAPQQVVGGDDQAGGAESALHCAGLDERLL